jgi:hypothetical protein
MQTKFDFYEDPSHGWCKVPKSVLNTLGIASKISPYSYERGEFAYLEEDCDLSVLHDAFLERGLLLNFRTHVCRNKQSKIRSYSSYRYAS